MGQKSQQKKPKGLPKRTGKRKQAGYYLKTHARLKEKKLRHVLRHNGKARAKEWADTNLMLVNYRKLVETS